MKNHAFFQNRNGSESTILRNHRKKAPEFIRGDELRCCLRYLRILLTSGIISAWHWDDNAWLLPRSPRIYSWGVVTYKSITDWEIEFNPTEGVDGVNLAEIYLPVPFPLCFSDKKGKATHKKSTDSKPVLLYNWFLFPFIYTTFSVMNKSETQISEVSTRERNENDANS